MDKLRKILKEVGHKPTYEKVLSSVLQILKIKGIKEFASLSKLASCRSFLWGNYNISQDKIIYCNYSHLGDEPITPKKYLSWRNLYISCYGHKTMQEIKEELYKKIAMDIWFNLQYHEQDYKGKEYSDC